MEYNKIISTLKKAEPVLDNTEELTDRIMQKVERMPVGIRQKPIILIAGIISSVAASVLICFFAYETLKFPVSHTVNYSEREFCETFSLSKIHSKKIAELGIKEKGEIIETIIKSKNIQRMRKEQLKLSLSSLNLE